MKFVGAHVSIAEGIHKAPKRAHELGSTAFAMFTCSQLRWQVKPLVCHEVTLFQEQCEAFGIARQHVLPHAGYLINLGAPDPNVLQKSRSRFIEEFRRCHILGLNYLNFHPGSHLGKMEETACVEQITTFLNEAISQIPEVIAVYECTAGQGNQMGHSFQQLAALIDGIEDKSRIGICLDTCHLHAAGYDLSTAHTYERSMQEFESIVGGSYLIGAHLNDSKPQRGSRVDRHASIGSGTMGWEPFRLLMNDSRFDRLPLIIETTNPKLWAEEISQLHGLVESNQ